MRRKVREGKGKKRGKGGDICAADDWKHVGPAEEIVAGECEGTGKRGEGEKKRRKPFAYLL